MRILWSLIFVVVIIFFTDAQIHHVQGTVETIIESDTLPVPYVKITFIDQAYPSHTFEVLTDTAGMFVTDVYTSVDDNIPTLPSTIELEQNYPNPFSGETEIPYRLNEQSDVTVRIYNILGQEVRTFQAGVQRAGVYGIRWDGRDTRGMRVSPGVYFYQLQAGDEMQVRRMLVGFGDKGAVPADGFQIPERSPHRVKKPTDEENGSDLFTIQLENTENTSPFIIHEEHTDVTIQSDTTLNFLVDLICHICPPEYEIIDYYPAWSPDSTTIAYVHLGQDEPGLYLIDADGSNKRRILTDIPSNPAWSPDGEWIAYAYNAQIYKIRVDDGYVEQLTTEGRNFFPAWSPDGEWIAYDNTDCGSSIEPPPPNSCGILIMRNNGTDNQLIIDWARYPTWHPEDQTLLGVIGVSPYDIWKQFVVYDPFNDLPPDTLDAVVGSDNRYPRHSPDGEYIAMTSQAPDKKPKIWIIDSDDSNARQLTDVSANTCDWSPDGEWIIYTDTTPGNGRLWLIRKDGTDKIQFTFD